ncbi:MAG: outer membrane lipoprotein carrier protein LolA [Acidobacteria bacterium]|nr:outer membrane lipoprotein carrier protein LolA [Acidobacteriota bacterium]
MTRIVCAGVAALLVGPASAAEGSVEYMLFTETYSAQGRPRKTESGELFLRKPGKMRWQYASPAGKLFLSDGKNVYYYTPLGNKAEKLKLKETEDMRAPLAFLLGKLDFSRDFKNFQVKNEAGATVIAAVPKSDKLPYQKVEFAVSPAFEIRKLDVYGYDATTLSFVFENERLNPPVDDKLFKFKLPPGAKYIDSSAEQTGN